MIRKVIGHTLAFLLMLPIYPFYWIYCLGNYLDNRVSEWRITAWCLASSYRLETWANQSKSSPPS